MAVADLLGDIAELVLADLDALGDEMDAALGEIEPDLVADAAIAADMSASNRANLRRLLTALARRDGQPVPGDAPPEALDIARTVVRRGIDVDVIFQGYRRGQNLAWQRWMEYAARVVPPGPELMQVLERSSEVMFAYVDQVLGGSVHGRMVALAGRWGKDDLPSMMALCWANRPLLAGIRRPSASPS